jgi:hypothetical protein
VIGDVDANTYRDADVPTDDGSRRYGLDIDESALPDARGLLDGRLHLREAAL